MAFSTFNRSFPFWTAQANPVTARGSMVSRSISHYRVLKKLGAGGIGEVYLAEDTRLARTLPPEPFTRDGGRVRRFVRAAEAACALDPIATPPPTAVVDGAADLKSGHKETTITDG